MRQYLHGLAMATAAVALLATAAPAYAGSFDESQTMAGEGNGNPTATQRNNRDRLRVQMQNSQVHTRQHGWPEVERYLSRFLGLPPSRQNAVINDGGWASDGRHRYSFGEAGSSGMSPENHAVAGRSIAESMKSGLDARQ